MKVLFLCMDMHNGFHGSFMHVLEYGEYFLAQGDEVAIGSMFISDANRKFAEAAGFEVYPFGAIPLNETWDLVYALHLLLFPALFIRGLRYKKAINMILSAAHPIEALPPAQFWPQYDLITAISEEAAVKQARKFDLKPEMFTIMPNHIPLKFLDAAHKRQSWNPKPARICVVSNNYTPELHELATNKSFKVDFYGFCYDNNRLVTPELLDQYDAVITIGKTVQYCLGLGIPVFQYDKFGGCGFIGPQNMEEEEKTNFSGRGTGRKLIASEIEKEILEKYPAACAAAPTLREKALERYGLDKMIKKQLDLVNANHTPRPRLGRDALLFANSTLAAMMYIGAALKSGPLR